MKMLKEYMELEIELVVFMEEVVRTSNPGEGEGELPIQPIFL